MVELLVKAINVSYQLLGTLSSYIGRAGIFPPDIPERAFIQYETGMFFVFSDDWQEHPAVMDHNIKGGLLSRAFRSQQIYLPGFYYNHFADYARQPANPSARH